MIEFWSLAGLIGLLVLATIVWAYWRVLPSLDRSRHEVNRRLFQQRGDELKQEHERGELSSAEYQALVTDLQLSLLSEPELTTAKLVAERYSWPGVVGATVFVLGLALMLYLKHGSYQSWLSRETMAQQAAPLVTELLSGQRTELPADLDETQFRNLLAALQRYSHEEPSNAQVWYWLGFIQSQSSLPEEGITALERAYRLAPEHAEISLALAQAYLMQKQPGLTAKAIALLQYFLQQQPKQPGATLLLGMAFFSDSQYQRSIDTWQSILDQPLPNPQLQTLVESSIAQAKTRLAQQQQPAATVSATQIRVHVDLGANFANLDLSQKQLVVFAKAAEGPPMPLAVVRLPAHFPADVVLDDQSAMMPNLKLSSFPQVRVTARVTSSTDVMPKSGDLEAVSDVLQPEGKSLTLNLQITSQRP